MPAGQEVWLDIAKKFNENGLTPKLWIGDSRYDSFAKSEFPECEILNFSQTHKSICLKVHSFDLDTEILFSQDFFRLKDQVYKFMDRQDDLGIYTRLDREAFFYHLFCYLYNKINNNNISLAIVAEGPHSPASMIIYGICKILNIRTYHLAQNSLVPLAHIATDLYGSKLTNLDKLNNYNYKEHLSLIEHYIDSIKEEIPTPLYMQIQSDNNRVNIKKDLKKYLLLPAYRSLLYSYNDFSKKTGADYSIYKTDFYKSNRPSLLHDIKIAKKKASLKAEYSKISVSPDFKQDYVFVPLHYEPERTSNPDGGHFYNVYDMLVALRSYVPEEIKIILKEHPSQFTKDLHGHRGRSSLFYKSILSLPNVEFANIDTSSSILIRNSIFVATQTGTAALEAAITGKKSLIFGTPWFLGTPNLYEYNSIPFFELIKKEVASRLQVKEYILNYATKYTLPVCVNPSGYEYYKKKYPDKIENLLDNTEFAQDFISIIKNDFQNR